MSNLIEEPQANIKQRAKFKLHFIIYILVIIIFWVLWVFRGSGHVWPIWPTIGWGIGILVHYLRIRNNTLQNEI